MSQTTEPVAVTLLDVMQVAERAYDGAMRLEQSLQGYYDPQTGRKTGEGIDTLGHAIVDTIEGNFGANMHDALGHMQLTLREMARDLCVVADALEAEQQRSRA